jgi:hypothetical protein
VIAKGKQEQHANLLILENAMPAKDAQATIREAASKAAAVLVALLESDDEALRLRAAVALLDRAAAFEAKEDPFLSFTR